ncbi:hypothetical protein SVIOM74S_07464 [Streptomyces violarus]
MMSTVCVSRIAFRPWNGVHATTRREIEPKLLARHGTHGGDDPIPVLFPGLRVRPTPMGVRGAVHFPAEHDDRVRHLQLHQPLGEDTEVVIELPGRALPQQPPDLAVGDALLIALLHGDVEDEHALGLLVAPVRPHLEEVGGTLDVAPAVARQIGVSGAELGAAQPVAEQRHPGHTAGIGLEEDTEGRGFLTRRSGGQGRGQGDGRRREGRGRGHGCRRARCRSPRIGGSRHPHPRHGAGRQGGRRGDRCRAQGKPAGPGPLVLWGHACSFLRSRPDCCHCLCY